MLLGSLQVYPSVSLKNGEGKAASEKHVVALCHVPCVGIIVITLHAKVLQKA